MTEIEIFFSQCYKIYLEARAQTGLELDKSAMRKLTYQRQLIVQAVSSTMYTVIDRKLLP